MKQLRQATNDLGTWEDALSAAEASRQERSRSESTSEDDAPTNDGPVTQSPLDLSNGDTETTLRKRINASSNESAILAPTTNQDRVRTTGNRVLSPDEVLKPAPHPLVDHPDDTIAVLAREYSELESELTSAGPEYVRWPDNITLKNFATYMIIPTLVYELEYPRTDRYVYTR